MENQIEKIAKLRLDELGSYELDSAENYRKACAMLLMIKALSKEVQETFSPIKTKAHAAWKEALDQERRHSAVLAQAEKILREKINEYAANADDLAAENISYRNDWKFRISDERMVPREFLEVSESRIRERVRALGPVATIPGVEIWQEKNVVASEAVHA